MKFNTNIFYRFISPIFIYTFYRYQSRHCDGRDEERQYEQSVANKRDPACCSCLLDVRIDHDYSRLVYRMMEGFSIRANEFHLQTSSCASRNAYALCETRKQLFGMSAVSGNPNDEFLMKTDGYPLWRFRLAITKLRSRITLFKLEYNELVTKLKWESVRTVVVVITLVLLVVVVAVAHAFGLASRLTLI